MMIYLTAAFFVCLATSTWAQYYRGQPQGYSPQQQQNAEAWRRLHIQQRHQQQHQQQQASYNSARSRPTSPMASPAAYSQNANYYSQRQPQQASAPLPQYSQPQYQQYYQQRQPQSYQPRQPSMGYAPSAQSYGSYQQPQYYQPPPVTPPPLTTPAELGSAFADKSSLNLLSGINSLTSLVTSPAAQSYSALSRYARQNNIRYPGTEVSVAGNPNTNYRHAASSMGLKDQVNALLQQVQSGLRTSAVHGQNSGSNFGIGASPGANTAIQLLSRINQGLSNPYNARSTFNNPMTNLQNRGNLQHALANRRLLPQVASQGQRWPAQTPAHKTTHIAQSTTPSVPVVTEFEYEGPTTTTPMPKRAIFTPHRGFPQMSVPTQKQQRVTQPYYPQPYPTFSSVAQPPPGFISIDAFRGELMSAIQLLTNEIAVMTNSAGSGINSNSAATPTINAATPTATSGIKNRDPIAALFKSKKLASLPSELTFLLGQFASKLPQKTSENNIPQPPQNTIGFSQSSPQKQQPRSEWSGVLDMTPEQQQLSQSTWSQIQPQQWSSPQHQQAIQPKQQAQTFGMQVPQGEPSSQTTLSPSTQQNQHVPDPQFSLQSQTNQQPSHNVIRQPAGSSWRSPPLDQFPGPSTPGPQHQYNQSSIYEQQPPPADINQQGPPLTQTEPHPLDMQGQQPWPPASSHYQHSSGPQWSQMPPKQQPLPRDLPQSPLGPSWREPPPQPSQGTPNLGSHHQHPQQLVPFEQHQYQQQSQQQQPLDRIQGPTSQPQREPQLLDLPWQQPPTGSQHYQQQPPPQSYQQQPGPQSYQQEPPPLEYQQQHGPQSYQQQPGPLSHQQQPPPQSYQEQPGPQSYQRQPPPQSYQQQPGPQSHQQQPPPQEYQQQSGPQSYQQQPPPQSFQQQPGPQSHPQQPPPQEFQQQPGPQQLQQHYAPQEYQQQPLDLQWPAQQQPQQQPLPPQDLTPPPFSSSWQSQTPPPQELTPPPFDSSWQTQTPPPFDPYQQPQQPHPTEQYYHQQPLPQPPQRPPPLDISNYRPPNSQYEPFTPRSGSAPSHNYYDPSPSVEFGGMNPAPFTSPM